MDNNCTSFRQCIGECIYFITLLWLFYLKLFNCLCDWRVQNLLNGFRSFGNFCRRFFNKSDGREIFLSLLKYTFKTKTLHQVIWKKKLLCSKWEFLNCWFYTAHENDVATPKSSTERLFWKISRMAEALFI